MHVTGRALGFRARMIVVTQALGDAGEPRSRECRRRIVGAERALFGSAYTCEPIACGLEITFVLVYCREVEPDRGDCGVFFAETAENRRQRLLE